MQAAVSQPIASKGNPPIAVPPSQGIGKEASIAREQPPKKPPIASDDDDFAEFESAFAEEIKQTPNELDTKVRKFVPVLHQAVAPPVPTAKPSEAIAAAPKASLRSSAISTERLAASTKQEPPPTKHPIEPPHGTSTTTLAPAPPTARAGNAKQGGRAATMPLYVASDTKAKAKPTLQEAAPQPLESESPPSWEVDVSISDSAPPTRRGAQSEATDTAIDFGDTAAGVKVTTPRLEEKTPLGSNVGSTNVPHGLPPMLDEKGGDGWRTRPPVQPSSEYPAVSESELLPASIVPNKLPRAESEYPHVSDSDLLPSAEWRGLSARPPLPSPVADGLEAAAVVPPDGSLPALAHELPTVRFSNEGEGPMHSSTPAVMGDASLIHVNHLADSGDSDHGSYYEHTITANARAKRRRVAVLFLAFAGFVFLSTALAMMIYGTATKSEKGIDSPVEQSAVRSRLDTPGQQPSPTVKASAPSLSAAPKASSVSPTDTPSSGDTSANVPLVVPASPPTRPATSAKPAKPRQAYDPQGI
ncbi:MAG: hypothetical protein NVSMB1_16750 [Polyangiales bacterium]